MFKLTLLFVLLAVTAEAARLPLVLNTNHKKDAKNMRRHALRKFATGTIAATAQPYDSEYLCLVQVGTPAQTLNLQFDTGSSDLWLHSIYEAFQDSGHIQYDPTQSTSWARTNDAVWNITYGDGTGASGIVGTDVVSLGGIVIPNQAIELATDMSSGMLSDNSDGLLGLAWPIINTVMPNQVATPTENMQSQNLLPNNVFTVTLRKHRQGGDFYFGEVNTGLVASGHSIAYTPVDNSQGFWGVSSTSAYIGAIQSSNLITRAGNQAIMDTGTTLIIVSDQLCSEYYRGIAGSFWDSSDQVYTFPAASKPPSLTLAIGNGLYVVPGTDMCYSPSWYGDDYCVGAVQPRGNMPTDIFGDVVLKNIVAVFDFGNQQFGAARRRDVKY